jgi:hypothetical protein
MEIFSGFPSTLHVEREMCSRGRAHGQKTPDPAIVSTEGKQLRSTTSSRLAACVPAGTFLVMTGPMTGSFYLIENFGVTSEF